MPASSRRARARRDHDRLWAMSARTPATSIASLRRTVELRAQLAQVLHQVVGERVVVVDHQNSHRMPRHRLTCSAAAVSNCARRAERPDHRARLVDRLLVLAPGIGVGDDAAAGLDVDACRP